MNAIVVLNELNFVDPVSRQSLSREAALYCDVKFICNRGKVEVYAHSMVLNKGANSEGLRQMIDTARIENNKKIIPLGSGLVSDPLNSHYRSHNMKIYVLHVHVMY